MSTQRLYTRRPRLLVVDDDHGVLSLISSVATHEGFEVETQTDALNVLHHLRERPADLVMLDVHMPDTCGLQTLRELRLASRDCPVVIMSGHAAVDDAIETIKLGGLDYLTKPFDFKRLRAILARVRDEAQQRRTLAAIEGDLAQRLEFQGMIGRAPAMRAVFDLIRRLAPHARSALVRGETGTGKELVARALHRLGPRSEKPFLAINCSAVVETLFESELFGHVRGAFTGATTDKQGLFEAAHGGTVFLDEVGELPLAVQAKLLRVLENGEVQPVGAVRRRTVNVRVITATNRDLAAESAAGRFRSDLYYRMNVAELVLPPLRDRREDIPLLTASFIREFAHGFGKVVTGVTADVERRLIDARWEGNVRQLRNVLERACMLTEDEIISTGDLPPMETPTADARDAQPNESASPLTDVQRQLIVRILEEVNGNKAAAARRLRISRRALYRCLERHGLC